MKTSHERGEQKRFLQLFINPFKAAQGQRVLSPADFKGEARALKFREEPIFEAAVACERHFYQAVTAGAAKFLPIILPALRRMFAILPKDFFPWL